MMFFKEHAIKELTKDAETARQIRRESLQRTADLIREFREKFAKEQKRELRDV